MMTASRRKVQQWVREWRAGHKAWVNISEAGRPLFRIAPGIVGKVYRQEWPQVFIQKGERHQLIHIHRPIREINSILREFEIQLQAARHGLAVEPLALVRHGRDALFIMREAPTSGQSVTSWLATHHADPRSMQELRTAIGAAVRQLHGLNILHGDLHAANMWFIPSEKKVLLLDFEWSWSDIPAALMAHAQSADATIMRHMRHWRTTHDWLDERLFTHVIANGHQIGQPELNTFFDHWASHISRRTRRGAARVRELTLPVADKSTQVWIPQPAISLLQRPAPPVSSTPSMQLGLVFFFLVLFGSMLAIGCWARWCCGSGKIDDEN